MFFINLLFQLLNVLNQDIPQIIFVRLSHQSVFYIGQLLLLDHNLLKKYSEQEEGRLWVRLGAYAVLKGWINQGTVDFFVENLYPERATESPFIKPNKS